MLSEGVLTIMHLGSILLAFVVVLVTEYLHLLGLRSPALEHGLLRVYPRVANTIGALSGLVVLTTLLMLSSDPTLLTDASFVATLVLLAIAIVNGFFLHHEHFPAFFSQSDERIVHLKTVASASVSMSMWTMILAVSIMPLPVATLIIATLALTIALFAIAATLEKRASERKRRADHVRIKERTVIRT